MTQPTSAPKPRQDPFDDEPDAWRHPPRPAQDESATASLGRAVSEVVTGSTGSGTTSTDTPDLDTATPRKS